jgi:hypothetical protein
MMELGGHVLTPRRWTRLLLCLAFLFALSFLHLTALEIVNAGQ